MNKNKLCKRYDFKFLAKASYLDGAQPNPFHHLIEFSHKSRWCPVYADSYLSFQPIIVISYINISNNSPYSISNANINYRNSIITYIHQKKNIFIKNKATNLIKIVKCTE